MQTVFTFIAANIIGILVALIGIALLVLEMYVPGFGAPGILGIAMLILGYILIGPTLQEGLILLLVFGAILCIALIICLRSASKGRFDKSRLVLRDIAVAKETPESNHLMRFIGKEGIAKTALRPAGICDFDGVRLNVVSNGEFIENGARVKVIAVEGNRVLVSSVSI